MTKPNEPGTDEARFHFIAQSPIATVVTDPHVPDNPVIAVNRAFCDLTGYAEQETIGRNCRFLGGPGSDAAARALLRDAVAQGRPVLVELINYKKDGTAFRNAVMVAPILDENGKVAYFLGSQMEVTPDAASPPSLRGQHAAGLVQALTPRQHQVLEQMIHGYRNKQIAAALGIDEKTVKMHRARMLAKLGAATSADAIRIGVEAEFLSR